MISYSENRNASSTEAGCPVRLGAEGAMKMEPQERPAARMQWMAEGLTQAMREANMLESPLYQAVLEHLGPSRTVVDVGAGVGRFTIPLAQAGCRVWAVEPSPVMREHLTQHLQAAGEASARVTVVPEAWPLVGVPPAEVALSTYVIQLATDPVAFAQGLEHSATRQVVLSIHIDPMPMAELMAMFHPEQPIARHPCFRDLYPILLDGGIWPDVRIIDEPQFPSFAAPEWAEKMLERLQLKTDPQGQKRFWQWIEAKKADGTLTRPHRFALLTWTPGAHSR